MNQKLFLGAKLRRLRRDLALGQAAMAAEIGISPSYLNHLERNQRPVTAQVLLRLADAYDIDIKAFAADGDTGAGTLEEIFRDPLLADLAVPRFEVAEVLGNAPGVAEAVARLYAAVVDRRQAPAADPTADGAQDGARGTPDATDFVREHIQSRRNHFAAIDEAAESRPLAGFADAAARLQDEHRVDVRVVAPEVMAGAVRHFDHHRRRLMLSALLRPASRTFAAAYQLALFDLRGPIAAEVEAAAPPDAAARGLLVTALGNYAAAAMLMPYARFHEAAEAHRYDVDRLAALFNAGVEQVSHRLTTLGRPGARGVPLFMLRTDAAGNISKRFAGDAFPFSRFGGTCPRWNLHAAFRTPGRVVTQIVETPDGARFFTWSRAVDRSVRLESDVDHLVAIGLGCDLRHATRIGYADGLDLARPRVTGIGPACRLCERPQCPDRAAPPAGRRLVVSEGTRAITPYPFGAA